MSEEAPAVSTETAPVAPAVATGEAPEKPTAEKPAEAPPRTYSQEEMDRITAKVKKNAAYRAKKEAEAYYKGLQQGTAFAKPAEKPQVQEEKVPARESFGSYEEYLDAKADFTGRKAAREEREKGEREAKAVRESEARAKVMTDFQSKVRSSFPDIEERLADIGHIEMPPGMGDAIAESAVGPQILNHLSENPKDCERIAALSASAAIREIGKLEARLEAKATPAEKPAAEKPAPKTEAKPDEAEPEPKTKPSKAPEPITPLGGKAADINAEPSLEKDGGKAWIDWRNRQEYARRTGTK